jgi:hypothetical protein
MPERQCCLRLMNVCSATYTNQRRKKEKEDRVAFLRVPKNEKLRRRFMKRLGWVAGVPFPEDACLCHTHFPAEEVNKTKNGYRRKDKWRSLPLRLDPARVARAWRCDDDDDSDAELENFKIDASASCQKTLPSSTPDDPCEASTVPTEVRIKFTRSVVCRFF